MPKLEIILASASPQRRAILQSLSLAFDVVPSSVDETKCAEPDPLLRSIVLARMKAQDVAAKHSQALVIGCDTLVVASDGTLLEKPVDAADASRMLAKQSGSISIVHSGLCLIAPGGKMHEGVSSSKVFFKKLSEQEIEWWIDSGLWKDRSGSFQIEGKGQLMIEKIEGDFSGIVGLPVFLLGRLLSEATREALLDP